jgi:hypothetical protein
MTCTICGSQDDVAERDGRKMCPQCAERIDWSRIIDMVQSGAPMAPTVSFTEPPPSENGGDPFA